MRENEFEKQVQDKMGGFNLHPTDEVWVEVERRIRKERKRRLIFWWPLLFLFIAGGITTAILFTSRKEKKDEITHNTNTKDTKQSTLKNAIELDPEASNSKMENRDSVNKRKTIPAIQVNSNASIISSNKQAINLRKNLLKDNLQKNNDNETSIDMQVTSQKNISAIKRINEDTGQQNLDVDVTSKQVNPFDDPDEINDKDVAETPVALIKERSSETLDQTTDSIITVQKSSSADKKNKKWEWGITFSVGRSSLANGLGFFNNSLLADATTFQSSSSGTVVSNFSGEIRPSISLATGLSIKKSLTEKLDISIGLGYSYLSTKINVGNRVDSQRVINNSYSSGLLVNNFYRSTGTTNYTNQFHFINLSSDVSWKLINKGRLKVYWENGLSFSQLLGSTMVHYDRNLPGYYRDNRRLNRNHIFFTTGLSIPVSKRMLLNPFASYSFTSVLKSSDFLQANYTNFGIRFKFLLNKK